MHLYYDYKLSINNGLKDMWIIMVKMNFKKSDNQVGILYAYNPIQYNRTKHIEIDKHFIKERFDSDLLCIPYMRKFSRNKKHFSISNQCFNWEKTFHLGESPQSGTRSPLNRSSPNDQNPLEGRKFSSVINFLT